VRGLVRWWLAKSWTSPVLLVFLTTLPLFVFCVVITAIAPADLVMSFWVFTSAVVFERVKPARRLFRMRRYRAWARKQHRGPERLYIAKCACIYCSYVRRTDPMATEIFDAMLESGAISVTSTSRTRVITTGMTCGRCAAGMECELCQ
jgi:hypothetical protein